MSAYKTTQEHLKWLAGLAWADGWARYACLANLSPTGATSLSAFLAAELTSPGYVRASLTLPSPFTVAYDNSQSRAECPAIVASFASPDGELTYNCLFVLATKSGQTSRVEGFVSFSPDETIPMGRTREFTLRYNLAGGNSVDVEVE